MNQFNVSFPGLGIENLAINRIAFSFNIGDKEINIYWYGIIIAVAFLVCLLLSVKQAPQFGIKSDDMVDTFLLIIVLALVGARLYYVAFSWEYFSDNPLKIFQTRYGGLAFYGGFIGGILAVVIMSKIKKIKTLHILDFLAVYVPLGHAIGRWGNFVNQEAFGTNTDLPWGMYSEQTNEYLAQYGDKYAPLSPVHPTFLYESLANIIIFIILFQIRKKIKPNRDGSIVAWYCILYGLVRFGNEGLRTDSLFIGNTTIRVSQALSLGLVVLGCIILYIVSRRKEEPAIVSGSSEKSDFVKFESSSDDNTEKE